MATALSQTFLFKWLTLAAIAGGTLMMPAHSAAADKPNIVIILADDMGIGDLGAYNRESKIPTPHMDKFAAQGMRFTDMHTPSSVCTPTRYGLLTGRYCWRTRLKSGVLGGNSPMLIEEGRWTLASMLMQQGYRTGVFGKWHLGLGNSGKTDYTKELTPGPNSVGFDESFVIPASLDMEPYVWVHNTRVEKEPTEKIAGSQHRRQGGGGFWRGGDIAPGFRHVDVLPRTVDNAIAFVEACAAKPGQPFFAYVPLSAPHTPWVPAKEWEGKSKVGYYGDFVMQTDHEMGRILAALDRLKLTDSTLVIITSDNGSHWPLSDIEKWGHRANFIYRGQKADIHDGGHRVPFLVRWPGKVKAGAASDQLACLTDLLATLAAVAGQKLPDAAGEDSFNLLAAWLGTDGGKPIRPAVVHHSALGMFAIRSGPWKLCMGLGSGGFTAPARIKPKAGEAEGQLYNLTDDPSEAKNVYQDYPQEVAKLTALLKKYQEQGHSNR